MALTNQPYLPLYVDDWMNNNKLKMCSAGAHGLMISIMCVSHKESTYGKILLRQKYKQTDKQILNFALQIAKLTAFDFAEVEVLLTELISERVLIIDEDYLLCKRMVRDAEISEARSKAGKNGGNSNKNKNFAYTKDEAKPQANDQAKSEANTVNENGVVIESVIEDKNESVVVKKEKAVSKKIEIIYPFPTENFKVQWQLWKTYKSKEHNFKYKSELSEQASLNELHNLSDGDESKAIAIMNQSMTKGWKGLFQLKNNGNGKQQSDNGSTRVSYSDDFQRKIVEGLQS